MIDFAHPLYFWLLLILVPLGLWSWFARLRKKQAWEALGQVGLAPGDRTWLVMTAIGFGIVGLAEPRWGNLLGEQLPAGRDVIFLVDVSRSMSAEDAIPNRLGVGIETGRSLVKSLGPGDRAAVVAFAGRARMRCPLTENLGAVDQALRSLKPAEVQPGGSNLGAAIEEGLAAFGEGHEEHSGGRSMVLISDGEDHVESWPAQMGRLVHDAIVVTTIGVGDPELGVEIPTEHGPLVYKGEQVKTRRVDGALAEIAATTGGVYLPVGLAAVDLGPLDRSTLAPAAKRIFEVRTPPQRAERFGPVVMLSLALLLLSCRPGRVPRQSAIAAAVSTIAVLVIAAGPTVTDLMAEGQRAFRAGEVGKAFTAFDQAHVLAPDNPIVSTNLGACLYQLARYPEARTNYLAARTRAGTVLTVKLDFALGNVALRLGDPTEAIEHYSNCLNSLAGGSELDSVRTDAVINKRFAEDLLKNPTPNPSDQEGSADPSESPDSKANQRKSQPSDNPNSGSGERKPQGGEDSPPSSPDSRLKAAIRAAQRNREAFRVPDEAPPRPNSDGQKDW